MAIQNDFVVNGCERIRCGIVIDGSRVGLVVSKEQNAIIAGIRFAFCRFHPCPYFLGDTVEEYDDGCRIRIVFFLVLRTGFAGAGGHRIFDRKSDQVFVGIRLETFYHDVCRRIHHPLQLFLVPVRRIAQLRSVVRIDVRMLFLIICLREIIERVVPQISAHGNDEIVTVIITHTVHVLFVAGNVAVARKPVPHIRHIRRVVLVQRKGVRFIEAVCGSSEPIKGEFLFQIAVHAVQRSDGFRPLNKDVVVYGADDESLMPYDCGIGRDAGCFRKRGLSQRNIFSALFGCRCRIQADARRLRDKGYEFLGRQRDSVVRIFRDKHFILCGALFDDILARGLDLIIMDPAFHKPVDIGIERIFRCCAAGTFGSAASARRKQHTQRQKTNEKCFFHGSSYSVTVTV